MLIKPSISTLLVSSICILSCIQNAVAESGVVNRHDIIEALSEPSSSEPPSRGIKIAPKKIKQEKIQVPADEMSTENTPEDTELASEHGLVVLDIKFEFNSSVLSSSAINQLNELGAALSSAQLNTGIFEVSGHTDSKGSAAYNKSLSLKRAQSVENYLLTHFKLEKSRLKSLGFGEEKPIFVTDPTHGANRRVEIRRTQ